MKRCRWAVATLLAMTAACAGPKPRVAMPREQPAEPSTLRIGVREDGRLRVQQVRLEAYVEATVLSEFAPAAGEAGAVEQMLGVQAVISRTYALAHLSRHGDEGFDLCATTHCQLYEPGRLRTSRWAPLAQQAVSGTLRKVLWFDGAPAEALFHADCGGTTASAIDVWGGAGRPYLRGMQDDGPAATVHSAWTFDATVRELRDTFNTDTRTAIGARFDGLTILDRDASGRAKRLAIHGARERIVTGAQLRDVLTSHFGARSVKSTWFAIQRTGNVLHFEGRGFGHGVGLCQAGAFARVRAGAPVSQVLERYYPGTKLVSLR